MNTTSLLTLLHFSFLINIKMFVSESFIFCLLSLSVSISLGLLSLLRVGRINFETFLFYDSKVKELNIG